MSEHTHHHEPETSKYEQALKKYDLNLSDEAVKEAVAKIIAEKVPENNTTEVKRFLMGSVEPFYKEIAFSLRCSGRPCTAGKKQV